MSIPIKKLDEEYLKWYSLRCARRALLNRLKITKSDYRNIYELDNIIGRWTLTRDNVNSRLKIEMIDGKFVSELVDKRLVSNTEIGRDVLNILVEKLNTTVDSLPPDHPSIFDSVAKFKKFVQYLDPALLSRLRSKADDSAIVFMLLRYARHISNGMQWSVPSDVLMNLGTFFDVKCECFGSPLNSTMDSFGSLYPDTDAIFGSVGDFFNQSLGNGSYTINPPFIESILNQCVSKLIYEFKISEEKKNSLRVFCFIPEWKDCIAYRQLMNSPLCRYRESLQRGKYFYLDGNRQIVATFNSSFFVLTSSQFNKPDDEPPYDVCCHGMKCDNKIIL